MDLENRFYLVRYVDGEREGERSVFPITGEGVNTGRIVLYTNIYQAYLACKDNIDTYIRGIVVPDYLGHLYREQFIEFGIKNNRGGTRHHDVILDGVRSCPDTTVPPKTECAKRRIVIRRSG